jgi:hypothetical protein
MVGILRGEGPLRPEKAKTLGYGPNASPLFALFRAFRRTSPQSKAAGGYARLLIVKDNGRAKEMAAYFNDGHPEYQDDSKWWELVEEADREALYGTKTKPAVAGAGGEITGSPLPAGLLDDENPAPAVPSPAAPSTPVAAPPPPVRLEIPSLSRNYIYQRTGTPWNVTAFEVAASDPALVGDLPWVMPLADIATRNYHFLYNPAHSLFSAITMTPRDALLTQLTWMTSELLRTSKETPQLGEILAEFRKLYGDDTLLDIKAMPGDASSLLSDLAKALVCNTAADARAALFDELSVVEQQSVMRALASRKIPPTTVTADGTFLQSAPFEVLRALVERHPELCFDGKIWDEPYDALDYGDNEITDTARASTLARYVGLINDAIWLARQDMSDLEQCSREELIRATMSLRLLRPDVETPS